jgi:hypothetical protein
MAARFSAVCWAVRLVQRWGIAWVGRTALSLGRPSAAEPAQLSAAVQIQTSRYGKRLRIVAMGVIMKTMGVGMSMKIVVTAKTVGTIVMVVMTDIRKIIVTQ